MGGCARVAEVTSDTPDQPIIVDAAADEWQDALVPVEGEDGLSMAVRNDADALYFTLVATDETLIQQIALRGLTVWFDPDGGKEKQLGIEFPLGRMADRRLEGDERAEPESWPPPRERGGRDAPRDLPEPRTNQLVLRYGTDTPGEHHPVDGVAGVQVAAALDTGTLIYELRVPLQAGDDAFALGVTPGTQVGLGLETPEIERPAGRGRRKMPGGGPPGGMGGRGPGGPGGPGGGQGMPPSPESLSTWMRVTLANG